jgi:predicted RNase H-like nuclease (RuvC/YqgF family)
MVGSAVAAFAVTWAALVRPLDRKVKRQAGSAEDIEAIKREQEHARKQAAKQREELVKLAAHLEACQRAQGKLEEATEKIQERLSRTVTEDEFAAYTVAMNQSMQTLVEKLGNATGAIEAWYRSQSGGR